MEYIIHDIIDILKEEKDFYFLKSKFADPSNILFKKFFNGEESFIYKNLNINITKDNISIYNFKKTNDRELLYPCYNEDGMFVLGNKVSIADNLHIFPDKVKKIIIYNIDKING